MRALNPENNAESFFSSLGSADEGLLLLDYDGTLAPLHARPMMAQPYVGVIDTLNDIMAAGGTRMVVISARRAEEVAALLPLKCRPEIWGLDGWERLMPDGGITIKEPPAQSCRELREALALLQSNLPAATRIEFKQTSVAVHWRGVPALTAARIKQAATAVWQKLPHNSGIDLVSFDGGVKLCNRQTDGNAAWEILSQSPGSVPVAYLGDDIPDEEGFAAVRKRVGLGVLVNARLRPTAADLWIRPPRELIAFLSRWSEVRKSHHH